VTGTVTGAEQRAGGLSLSIGGLAVGFDRVRRLLPGA
jgi:hypothetical protein